MADASDDIANFLKGTYQPKIVPRGQQQPIPQSQPIHQPSTSGFDQWNRSQGYHPLDLIKHSINPNATDQDYSGLSQHPKNIADVLKSPVSFEQRLDSSGAAPSSIDDRRGEDNSQAEDQAYNKLFSALWANHMHQYYGAPLPAQPAQSTQSSTAYQPDKLSIDAGYYDIPNFK